MMNRNEIKKKRQTLVALRRKWLLGSLAICFLALLPVTGRRFDSAAEIIGFAIVGSLVLTAAVSMASAPVIWILSRKQKKGL